MSEGTHPPNPPQNPQYPQGQYPGTFNPPPSYPAPGAPPAGGAPQTGVPGAPPMGAPPPGYLPEPGKKRSKVWLFLGVGLLALVLMVGGCGFLLFRLASGPLDATNDYAALLDEQRFDEAYDALAPACQAQTREDFVTSLSTLDITGYSFNGVSISGSDSETRGEVTLSGDDRRSADFTLDKINDEWMVCSFTVGEAGSANQPQSEGN